MRKRIAALLCVLLLLSGCSGGAEPSDGYVLYFQERDLRSAAGEGALRTESVQLEPTEAPGPVPFWRRCWRGRRTRR